MFKLIAAVAIAFIIGISSGLATGWWRWKSPPSDHKGYRWLVIEHHARQVRPGATLVIADSIVERQYLVDLCGPVLNAGIGSATVQDFVHRLRPVVALAKPGRA